VLDPHTLRGRLTLAYAGALVAALVAFAAVALAVVDREQRAGLDAQLGTSGRAIVAILDVSKDGAIVIEPSDRVQFAAILGAKANGAIVQRDGAILARTTAPPAAVLAVASAARNQTFATRRIGVDPVRIFAAPVEEHGVLGGWVVIWRDAALLAQLDRSLGLAFSFAIPAFVMIAILVGGPIARRGLAPLDRIATLASEIEARDLSRRLALRSTKDELGRLAATFDRMLDRLQRAFDRQQRFASDASHELRAPLSVIRAEADLALRRERDPAEYRRALETIAAEADALESLTRDLLAAARSDAAVDRAPGRVAIDDLAAWTAGRMTPLAEARGVRIEVDAAEPATITGHLDALERAAVTVTHNAIKYAASQVVIAAARVDGSVEFSVADDGPGFSDAALDRAFDRFWRDDAARSGEGSGLGLAIAQTIVTNAGGTIAIANRASGGAIVRMRFPAASREDELK
jgi:two-component system OmpR family sensor kinase